MAKSKDPSNADTYSFLFDLPDRTVTLACPDPYVRADGTPHTITVVVNAPDKAVVNRPILDVLADNIRAWTLTVNGGQPAPITSEALLALPPDLSTWLWREWERQRAAPLVTRVSSPTLNGSQPTADSPGPSLAIPTPN